MMRLRRVRFAAGVALALGATVAWAASQCAQRDDFRDSSVTLDEFWAEMSLAVTRPGLVMKLTVFHESSRPSYVESQEIWIDPSRDVARSETEYAYSVGRVHRSDVVLAGHEYSVQEDGMPYRKPLQECANVPRITFTLFFYCPTNSSDMRVRVIEGEYNGISLLGLLQTGHAGGIDSVVEFQDVLWIDPQTYIPFAFVSHGVDRYARGGYTDTHDHVRRYAYEFVSVDAIPADFFDPAAVGYVEP